MKRESRLRGGVTADETLLRHRGESPHSPAARNHVRDVTDREFPAVEDPQVLAIDVGGTFLKSALVNRHGRLHEDRVAQQRINSQGDRESILSGLVSVIENALDICRIEQTLLVGIGVGIPGPFDYEKARSLMKHKFQSIYGLDLRKAVFERSQDTPPVPILFESDAHAFLRGEAWLGAGQGYDRIVAVTIGTGLGSAFMENSEILHNGTGGPYRSTFAKPCEGGILEDFVSKRGIIRMYRELSGLQKAEEIDVEEIARRGIEDRNPFSIGTFQKMGRILGRNLKDLLEEIQADCLILGGQISKAFTLFEEALRIELESLHSLKKITAGDNIDQSALRGAAGSAFRAFLGDMPPSAVRSRLQRGIIVRGNI